MMRIEEDSLGQVLLHEDSYEGSHTYRAKENFTISSSTVDSKMLQTMILIKSAAASANGRAEVIDPKKVTAIKQAACDLLDHTILLDCKLDAIQGGAGTSTNMYINEVLANRGLEYLGHHKGEYQFLDPLDDVNRSQSTNDVYPSSGKIAVYLYMMELDTVLETLIEAFHKKSQEYATAQKMGRTQLQDAVPTTFGTTFSAFATSLLRCQKRLYASRKEITRLNLGGTAIGTGVNASPIYQQAVYEELNQLLPFTVYPADHLVDATQHIDQFVQISSSLKALAVALSKIAHDLRLMASGPRSGLGEIQLPKRQAGSSIMPGKVNPVIPEVVQQVAFQVMGSDLTITLAAQSGELELNPFEPILFHHLFLSLKSLTQVCHVFQTKCVEGIIVNETHCQQQVEQGVSLATRLTPLIGYQKASELVSKALQENQPIETFLSEEVILKLQKAHN